MKKIICIVLAAVAALSMCACGNVQVNDFTGEALTGTITTDVENTVAMEGYNAVATIHDWSKVDRGEVFGTAERTMKGKQDGEYYRWYWRAMYMFNFFHNGFEKDSIDGSGMRDVMFTDYSEFDYPEAHEDVEWTSEYDEATDTMNIYIYVGCEYTIDFDIDVDYVEE